jgi:hypothetical protein
LAPKDPTGWEFNWEKSNKSPRPWAPLGKRVKKKRQAHETHGSSRFAKHTIPYITLVSITLARAEEAAVDGIFGCAFIIHIPPTFFLLLIVFLLVVCGVLAGSLLAKSPKISFEDKDFFVLDEM